MSVQSLREKKSGNPRMLGWKKQYEQKSSLQKACLVSPFGLSHLQRTDNPVQIALSKKKLVC